MLRTSISPTIVQAGYRVNVIPSEAKATLDVRTTPDEDPDQFLEMVRKVDQRPGRRGRTGRRATRGPTPRRRGSTPTCSATLEANVTKHYSTIVLPTMLTGATDMAYLRAKGMQCYGIGPATDIEDGPKGFWAHSDQERILETEFQRYARFYYDVVRGRGRSPKCDG